MVLVDMCLEGMAHVTYVHILLTGSQSHGHTESKGGPLCAMGEVGTGWEYSWLLSATFR